MKIVKEVKIVRNVKIVKEMKKGDGSWRFACGDVFKLFFILDSLYDLL